MSLCRVCLKGNVRMLIIEDNRLLEIYKKLTNCELTRAKICCKCVSQLQICHLLSAMARKSPITSTHIHKAGIEVTSNICALNLANPHMMHTTAAHHPISQVEVKQEQVAVKQEQVAIKQKQVAKKKQPLKLKQKTVKQEQVVVKQEEEAVKQTQVVKPKQLLKLKQKAVKQKRIGKLKQAAVKQKQIVNQKQVTVKLEQEAVKKDPPESEILIKIEKTEPDDEESRHIDDNDEDNKITIHIKAEKTNDLDYFVCDRCKKQCSLKEEYFLRLQKLDTDEEVNICNICSKDLKKYGAKPTISTHSERAYYSCSVCNRVFKQASILNRHLRDGKCWRKAKFSLY